jgi:glycosyltransferase involved in cell wall biosynthesis
VKLTIGIKALNEEAKIRNALESALAAARPFGGEVVLADSGSTDRTLEIAREYPVRIVQLAHWDERCCGAGAQLAFQGAEGEFFYLLDGDMVLLPEFLAPAIALLEAHPDVAGVGGRMREMNTQSEEFQIRAKTLASWKAGEVDRLDGGALYRSAAVRAAGYFADRNLHAFEEFELAARLRASGYRLFRIDAFAVEHFSHVMGGYRLLWRRIVTGYAGAHGEVLRGAWGRSHGAIVIRQLAHIRHSVAVILWWFLLLGLAFLPVGPVAGLLAGVLLLAVPILFLWWRRGRLALGIYSFASWNVMALGLVTGFFRKRTSPMTPLATVILQDPNGQSATRSGA